MQKVQNTKMVNPVKISQVLYIDEIVKDPGDRAKAGANEAEDAERTRSNTRIPCVPQRNPVHKRVPVQSEEKTRGGQSRAAPEETALDCTAKFKSVETPARNARKERQNKTSDRS